jgi:TP53 regulating kinase-like protein
MATACEGLAPDWQGAEAKVSIRAFAGQRAIYKQRFKKDYRHSILDERLNSRRIVQEARCLVKAFKCNVKCPTVYFVDAKNGLLVMEYINGVTAKERIISDSIDLLCLGTQLGETIARLHSHDIIHGDLTTSNILLEENRLVLIDFGLASVSNSIEDRAVDLYVLERAITSTHPQCGTQLFKAIVESYGKVVSNSTATLSKLAQVQLRGRKRDMIG